MFEYLSRISLCSATRTKCPRIKYTPSSMFAEEPVAVASDASSCADSTSAPKLPTIPSAEISSPSVNTVEVTSSPVATYFTYSVIGSSVVAATA